MEIGVFAFYPLFFGLYSREDSGNVAASNPDRLLR